MKHISIDFGLFYRPQCLELYIKIPFWYSIIVMKRKLVIHSQKKLIIKSEIVFCENNLNALSVAIMGQWNYFYLFN